MKVDELLRRIEEQEKKISRGSVPRASGQFLHFLILATKSKKILELGCSVGYSAIWMSLAAKEFGGHIYTTELDEERISLAKRNFKEAKLDKYITLFEKDIFEVLSGWNKGKVDFVFIDAVKEDYLKYYEVVLPLLESGGVIVADDVEKYRDSMKDFFDKVENDSTVVAQFLDFDDGLMLIYKK